MPALRRRAGERQAEPVENAFFTRLDHGSGNVGHPRRKDKARDFASETLGAGIGAHVTRSLNHHVAWASGSCALMRENSTAAATAAAATVKNTAFQPWACSNVPTWEVKSALHRLPKLFITAEQDPAKDPPISKV